MTAAQAWNKLSDYLRLSERKKEYVPETIAECKDCFVFSIRLKGDSPGVSTGINPYIVYKITGRVINDSKLEKISKMKPIKMINPISVG